MSATVSASPVPDNAPPPGRRAYTEEEVGVSNHERFALELEFVQCLANPLYLYWLASKKYLENAAFVNYLRYLQYWKQPAYAKYLVYPHCLYFLDLLQDKEFRTAIADYSYAEHIRQQQDNFFRMYWSNRVVDQEKESDSPGAESPIESPASASPTADAAHA